MLLWLLITLSVLAAMALLRIVWRKSHRKGLDIWLPAYLRQTWRGKRRQAADKPVHIMLAIVDHYEPGNGRVSAERARERVSAWVKGYPEMADTHRDADGKVPQHSWFYPPHYHQDDHLERIIGLCRRGYGELELHLHHDHHAPFPEQGDSLARKITDTLDDYGKFGVWGSESGARRYAFIHGNWALGNSANGKYCGVNDELKILQQTGCYADFTYPAPDRCQPRMVNTIYYAKSDDQRPRAHDEGRPVQVGGSSWGHLMIIQGPLGIRWKGRPFRSRPCIETAELDHTNLPVPTRIDHWVKTGIHVQGKPDWIFIKLHCHGAPEIDHDCLIGESADAMFSYFEKKYNDGTKYVLHYVNAREMYNIIKAAEAGLPGNPNDYRDYKIKPPAYLAQPSVNGVGKFNIFKNIPNADKLL